MSVKLLRENFLNLLRRYSEDEKHNENCWAEVKTHYLAEYRYYHNLNHLWNMLLDFNEVRNEIKEPDMVLFAIFYHDIIYQPEHANNENKSAMFFKKTMSSTNFPLIKECMELIVSSKDHNKSSNPDCNFFLDIDLAILGEKREKYIEYCENIKKEFCAVPDIVYKKERRKILINLLEAEQIFKTAYFKKSMRSKRTKIFCSKLRIDYNQKIKLEVNWFESFRILAQIKEDNKVENKIRKKLIFLFYGSKSYENVKSGYFCFSM